MHKLDMGINSRFFGGVLLVCGTSIGAGMLGLPVSCALGGFFPSLGIFILVWALMFLSAHFLLEANLKMHHSPNMISIIGKTLGPKAQWVSWVFYLVLLYSLLAAYITGCAPLITLAMHSLFGWQIPGTLGPFILPVFFSGCICFGTQGVDYLNRILLVGLIGSFLFLVGNIPPYMDLHRLLHFDVSASLLAVTVILTSFGYHIIIPTLVVYMNRDKRLLRKTIFIGSLIPLLVYIFWQLLVLGGIPLSALLEAGRLGFPATEPIAQVMKNNYVGVAARFFSFFSIITSFLGVALSLVDFLRDGLKIREGWKGKILGVFMTFIPPLVFVFFYQEGFYLALEYAGICVAVLLGILPCSMGLKTKKKGLAYVGIGLFCMIIARDLLEKGSWL